jgi:hypothetical protein
MRARAVRPPARPARREPPKRSPGGARAGHTILLLPLAAAIIAGQPASNAKCAEPQRPPSGLNRLWQEFPLEPPAPTHRSKTHTTTSKPRRARPPQAQSHGAPRPATRPRAQPARPQTHTAARPRARPMQPQTHAASRPARPAAASSPRLTPTASRHQPLLGVGSAGTAHTRHSGVGHATIVPAAAAASSKPEALPESRHGSAFYFGILALAYIALAALLLLIAANTRRPHRYRLARHRR